jgi:serine/threonine-protein kinase
MGEVYLANHALLRRPTAVKILQPGRSSEDALARFEREVQLTARLTHPNTVTIFDYGRAQDGSFYYAMELIDGFSLDELVRSDGPQPAARVVHLLQQAAAALEEAHAAQLIHRDIKPGNLMVCERGGRHDVVKVLDFGLVRDLSAAGQPGVSQSRQDVITGTPMYMSPEAISAPTSVDGRSDLYALGAVGYYLLTGRDVFEGSTVVEVCSKHLLAEPAPPAAVLGRPVPAQLAALLLRCLAKAPHDRPASAAELCSLLEGLSDCGSWSQTDARAWWESHPRPERSRPIEPRFLERSRLATPSYFELRVG